MLTYIKYQEKLGLFVLRLGVLYTIYVEKLEIL